MKNLIVLAALPAFALAACNQADSPAGNDTAAAADGKAKTVEQVAAEMQSAPKMRPGEWETTIQIVKMDMPDAPPAVKKALEESDMAGKLNTSRSCVTPEEAARDPREFLKKEQAGNCSYERFDFKGGTIDGKMICNNPQGGKMEATMTGTVGAEAIDMTVTNVMSGGPTPGNMSSTIKMTSKRVGECKSADAGQ